MKLYGLLMTCCFIAACGSDNAVPEPAEEASVEEAIPPVKRQIDPEDTAIVDVIPANFQGRWGLVAPDCEEGRSDAKGLVEIGPESMKFYESVAKLDKVTSVSADQITAAFDFEGEGQQWERIVMLRLENDGKTLIRTEPGLDLPVDYTRC